MPLSVGNLLLGTASQPMMSAIASSYASGKQDTLTFGYDTSNKITSIDGSAIVGEGAGDTSQCFPASASGMLQPSGNYLSATESSNYYPSSNPSGFITGVDLTNYATTAYVDSSVSGKLDASASGQFQPSGYYQPSGDYAHNSSLSSYLYASASSLFQPSGNYQTAGDYAYNSAVSSKLDASASSQFALSGDYAYNSSLSSVIAYSALESASGVITSISGTSLVGAGVDVPPTAELIIDTANMSGSSDDSSNYHIGVRGDIFFPSSSISSYATTADLSQKLSTATFTSYTASVIPVVIIANSADATAANTVYVVTGEPT